MAVTLSLENMSIEEKIQAMESIWEDLSKNAYANSSPTWHESVLKEREDSVKYGTDRFVEWESAKKRIRDSLKLSSKYSMTQTVT